jgi:hypothetical protein
MSEEDFQPRFKSHDIIQCILDNRLYRVVEHQPHNGNPPGCYWLEDCKYGCSTTECEEDNYILFDRPANPPRDIQYPAQENQSRGNLYCVEINTPNPIKNRIESLQEENWNLKDLNERIRKNTKDNIDRLNTRYSGLEDHKQYLEWLKVRDAKFYKEYQTSYMKYSLTPK